MFPGRSIVTLTTIAAVTVVLPFFVIGCGSEPAEFDKTANYTPEALAQELALRYRAQPVVQTSKLGPRKNKLASATVAAGKQSRKSATKTTKKSGPPTIDDVLDDIEYKITLIKGTSPAETTKKMIEAIASDRTLADSDKKTLTEHVQRLTN